MVDGIDANRNKWQDLCSSYQETRITSVSNLCPELDQTPELHKNKQPNELQESLGTMMPAEGKQLSSKSQRS